MTARITAKETNPMVKAAARPKSLRLAINAMCAHCMGCTLTHREPGMTDAIRNCTSHNCPLFEVRPYQQSGGNAE